jgi:hypothetical protein
MVQARAATPSERLPWLADEPAAPSRPRRYPPIAALVAAVLLAVAAASYWLGFSGQTPSRPQGRTITTNPSSGQPHLAEPQQPQVILQPAPQVNIAPQRELALATPRPIRRSEPHPNGTQAELSSADESSASAGAQSAAAPEATTPAVSPPRSAPARLTAWPASQSAGASGRIVRIGAFGSRQQAKLGWRYMVQAYPAVAHLKATVVGERNSRGRHFYRFQIGTTSQAHSEVLCQRMERIRLSCAVVGLSWKPGGVER